MDIDQLKEYTINFSLDNCALGNQGYNRVLLQLFGYLGHGKSSFINSCKYVLEDGEFRIYADAGHSHGGKTTRRITYPLTDTITLVDNRGCATMNSYETGEIFAQLGLDPIVVLTHKSQGDLTGIQAKFKNMGTEHIFQLENFTSSDHLRTRARSQEILTFCHEVLKNVEFRMRERRNPQRERAERKKFVLEFAHEREMKREMEKKEQEMAAQQAERERKRARDRKNESSCLLQ
ncbi:hypothetical protein FKM82_003083 [Ascaphus truei]